jgi:hypothetical protein
MNKLLCAFINENTPKVNPDVMNGLASVYLPLVESYLDSVMRSVSKGFPLGLEYVGYQRCTPAEEYVEITKDKSGKRVFNLARSDVYMVKYIFKYQGIELPPRYVYLPYSEEAGIIYLGGSRFHIKPVLSDKVISPGLDIVFVRLLRDKVTFRRCYHKLIINGVTHFSHVVWSGIYRKAKDPKKTPITTKAETCLVHYLLAKYGFTEMCKKMLGFVPLVGGDEITELTHPKSHWVICQSLRMKPKTSKDSIYISSNIKIAIPKEKWSALAESIVAGTFYVIDHFPTRVKPEYMNNTTLWSVLLGNIIFSGVYSEGKLYADIQEHFNSLNDYVDAIITKKLAESGYVINSFYELLELVIDKFQLWVLQPGSSSTSVYGKTMEVLYYVVYDITSGIFRANFRLNKMATRKQLTEKEIREVFNKQFTTGAIFSLNSGKIAVEAVSYSGDHKFPKITSVVSEQENASGNSPGQSKRVTVGEDKRLHVSMIEAGSLLGMPKTNPTPNVRINPYINLDLGNGTIVPNPKLKELLNKVSEQLKIVG